MNAASKNYISLVAWILALVLIGSIIGSLTQTEISTWYKTLHRSPLTPPNSVFPVVWTILYSMIATCGWLIWRASPFPYSSLIKSLYAFQLILNWSWTPLFFRFHLIGISLICLLVMDFVVFIIIYLGYKRIRWVALLMIPYLAWILFATYLNYYIWQYN